ncbi:MAG: VanW family protein [Clostridiales bacterium]|jgi:hypothetical protein|nr:VanW family protein [Clostridiales bacterium]
MALKIYITVINIISALTLCFVIPMRSGGAELMGRYAYAAEIPCPSRLSVDYYGENQAFAGSGEYLYNYRGITYSESLKITEGLTKRGYSETEAVCMLFDGLKEDLEKYKKIYAEKRINSDVIFYPDAEKKFEYTKSACGRRLDEKKFIDAIKTYAGKKKARVTLFTEKTFPEDTREKLEKITVHRSGFSTGYANSKQNRKENIKLAAKYINGTVVAPNEIFSFNDTVGKRTASKGFRSAAEMIDGKMIDGIGGGVCQVSTTIYNAALYADLEIVHAKRHSSKVGYIQPSFDAMVSEYNDLKFRNNTGCPLYICARADDSRIKIEFYGKPIDGGIEIRLRSKVGEILGYTDKIIENDGSYEIPEEGYLRISGGSDGCISEGYADYYRGGVRIKSVLIRKDVYNPMSGIVVKARISDNFSALYKAPKAA